MAGYLGDTKFVGTEKIVVAMDIGTTHSAVSYSYLYPDDKPRVRMVSKWPGQMESTGFSKIPTILAYQHGKLKACGPAASEYIDDAHYQVAKWFKLHLHPPSLRVADLPPPYDSTTMSSSFDIPPLPPNVPIVQVYADFLKYLMENVQRSFENSIVDGANIWARLRPSLVVIHTTPNGWEFPQQDVLRKASLMAGLTTKHNAHELLEFVTEGEASVHYTLAYSQSTTWLSAGVRFAVIDAGGSTVDSTLYECESTNPKVVLEEVCPSQCVQAGGIFVNRTAEAMIKTRLLGSKFGTDECMVDLMSAFENETKRLYDGTQSSYEVHFGSSRENDRIHGIVKGRLSLTAEEMSSCFEHVIDRVFDACAEIMHDQKIKFIILVGGFGESAYLQKRLRDLFEPRGASIVTAEEPSKKAAAEGAMLWFIKQHVTARVSRTTLGTEVCRPYRPEARDHVQRSAHVYTDLDGDARLPGGFSLCVAKGTRIHSDFTVVQPFIMRYKSLEVALESFSCDIDVWEGEGIPKWVTDVNGEPLPQMRTLCTLAADLSSLQRSLNALDRPLGKYYGIHLKIAVRLGGTQLQARLQWEEEGKPCEGPVTIIPNAII